VTPPIRVIHLRSSAWLGSPEKLVLDLARHLPSEEFDTTVASLLEGSNGRAFLEAAVRQGTDALPVPCRWALDPAPVYTLRQILIRRHVHVLCMHDYKADVIGLLAAAGTGVRTVGVFHGWTGEDRKIRMYQRLDRVALRRMDLVVAVSDANRRRLIAMGVPSARVVTIPNGIDADEFLGCTEIDPGHIRASLGLPRHGQVMVSAGRLSPEKGHTVLLEAFATIAPQMPDVWLVLLGDGPEYRRLAALADSLGITRRVLFAGYRKDIAAIFQVMDFLVLPSHTEGLPMVILEAFACGKPVVATTVGGVPEVVRQGETGLLIPEGDVAGLRRAMGAMLMDQPARERMGKGAYAWVRERFGIRRYAAEFADVFRRVANGN